MTRTWTRWTPSTAPSSSHHTRQLSHRPRSLRNNRGKVTKAVLQFQYVGRGVRRVLCTISIASNEISARLHAFQHIC